jgi:hypothetical protein
MDTNGKSALCEDEERVIGANEPRSADSLQIANAALQSIGMPNRNTPGTYTSNPEYAAAVSTIFTKATNQAIMLGTDPNRVLSTSILCNSLLHDTRFRRVPIREAAPGEVKLQQLAQDIAFAYGGKASDYYKALDDTDPKVQELMGLLDHLDTYGFKDAFLLALRRAQGGKSPQPADPHVLRAAMLAALGSLEDAEGATEKSEIEGLSANKSPQNRGRNNEGRVLKDIGKEKNTRTYSTSQGDTIPDFATQKEVGDIKDTKKLSNTQQLRAQREAAQGQGADRVVYTGENTQVSRPMQHSGTKLVRRSDLGPQQSK